MSTPIDRVRKALQDLLDAEGDGWHMSHFVVILGLEKFDGGDIVTSAWLTAPEPQADYVTDGLITAAQDLRWGSITTDDDD